MAVATMFVVVGLDLFRLLCMIECYDLTVHVCMPRVPVLSWL